MGHGDVRYAEDVQVGEKLGPLEKMLTTEMVTRFCQAWGNAMPNRFTDDEVARKDGLPAAIAPGAMTMAIVANLLTMWARNGQVRRLETLFRRPVRHNQQLRLVGEVRAKRVVEGEDQLECDVDLQQEDGETVVTGSAVLVLPSRAGATPS